MWGEEVNTKYLEAITRWTLSLLIWVIIALMLIGVGHAAYDIRLIFTNGFYYGFKRVMIDMLMVLALVEILRTVFTYFTEGRVRVSLIIDTVLVTILTELLAFWFRDMEWDRILMMICLVFSLSIVRILAVKFSPKKKEGDVS
jgi:uncharacterized membrane protein (DUF373 family)